MFEIDATLRKDCHLLGRLPGAHLLLHKNAVLPWFILVPETEVRDLLDLPADALAALMAEARHLSVFIKDRLGYPKVNVASIGNVVAQLHLHVVGRRMGDACWPKPVWGNLEHRQDYSAARLNDIRMQLRPRLV